MAGIVGERRALGLLWSLVVLLVLHTGSALKCYDCMSKSHPSCAAEPFDPDTGDHEIVDCIPEEPFCSTFVARVEHGNLLVTRQCASSSKDAEGLRLALQKSINAPLTQLYFTLCESELCNGETATAANATLPAPDKAMSTAPAQLPKTASSPEPSHKEPASIASSRAVNSAFVFTLLFPLLCYL